MGDLRSEIEAQIKGFLEAFNKGDAAGVASYYTKNARLLPPNAETMKGREAIQAAWQHNMDIGVKSAELEITEVIPMNENTACEIGKYKLKIEPEPGVTVEDMGKYVVIWKHDGDSWKLDIDIFNTSLPPQ